METVSGIDLLLILPRSVAQKFAGEGGSYESEGRLLGDSAVAPGDPNRCHPLGSE